MKKILFLFIYYSFARYLPKSYFPVVGKFAKKIRYLCCRNIFAYCGKDVNVERKAWFGRGDGIKIGDNSGLGVNSHIHANTILGKNVMMGPNCYMLGNTHFFTSLDISMREQGMKRNKDQVIIGDDVWIGRDVMILGSRRINSGSIIGARCLLTKSYPEYSIVGGNPSKLIRSRKESN